MPAFNGTNSAGVRCPWRFGNLNNGANAGLGYENGNNSPGNANWNGSPRLSVGADGIDFYRANTPIYREIAFAYPWET